MAESSTPAKAELLATKTVQELLTEGEIVPLKYIHKDGIPDPNSSVELMDTPVIYLDLLTPSSITVEQLDKLRSALTTWCCFQVINHGMTPEFLDEVSTLTKHQHQHHLYPSSSRPVPSPKRDTKIGPLLYDKFIFC